METFGVFLTIQSSTWITFDLIGLCFCGFFTMNREFWDFSYYSSLSFCIKCGGAKQVTYIDAGAVVESLETFRKLPRKSLASLGFISVARIYLKYDLSVWPRRVLGLTKDSRFCVHLRNGLANNGFISIVLADT